MRFGCSVQKQKQTHYNDDEERPSSLAVKTNISRDVTAPALTLPWESPPPAVATTTTSPHLHSSARPWGEAGGANVRGSERNLTFQLFKLEIYTKTPINLFS